MGTMRYRVLEVKEFSTNLLTYEVRVVRGITDDTNLPGIVKLCESWSRIQTSKLKKVRYMIEPWFDCNADVYAQDTVSMAPLEDYRRVPAPVRIMEDISQIATDRLIMPGTSTKAS